MPFIGLWGKLVPKIDEKRKEIISITILSKREYSVFAMEAVDDKGNKYDIINSYYYTFFKGTLKFKFEGGERHLAEIDYLYPHQRFDTIGKINIIKINSFGTISYL